VAAAAAAPAAPAAAAAAPAAPAAAPAAPAAAAAAAAADEAHDVGDTSGGEYDANDIAFAQEMADEELREKACAIELVQANEKTAVATAAAAAAAAVVVAPAAAAAAAATVKDAVKGTKVAPAAAAAAVAAVNYAVKGTKAAPAAAAAAAVAHPVAAGAAAAAAEVRPAAAAGGAAAAVARPAAAAAAAAAVAPAVTAAAASKRKADAVEPAKNKLEDEVVVVKDTTTTTIDGPQKTKLPTAAAAAAGAGASSSSSANHGKHDQKEDGIKSFSSMDQEDLIVMERAEVAKLASEFKLLHAATQDKYNRYSAAMTALKDAENVGFVGHLERVKRARDSGREGVEDDKEISRICDAEMEHRHTQNIGRFDAVVEKIRRNNAVAAAKDADPPTLKKPKAK
jgi:hypothetical protein